MDSVKSYQVYFDKLKADAKADKVEDNISYYLLHYPENKKEGEMFKEVLEKENVPYRLIRDMELNAMMTKQVADHINNSVSSSPIDNLRMSSDLCDDIEEQIYLLADELNELNE